MHFRMFTEHFLMVHIRLSEFFSLQSWNLSRNRLTVLVLKRHIIPVLKSKTNRHFPLVKTSIHGWFGIENCCYLWVYVRDVIVFLAFGREVKCLGLNRIIDHGIVVDLGKICMQQT